jgi:hypothetical protein
MGLMQGHALADVDRRGHLGGHGGLRVTHHNSRSPAARPVRRAKISAIAASLRAHAAFSARAQPPAASTSAASLNAAESAISGNEPSNIISKVSTSTDRHHDVKNGLWMNPQLWISRPEPDSWA